MKYFQVLILVLVSIVGAVQGNNNCSEQVKLNMTTVTTISSPSATTYKSPCVITIVKPTTPVAMYFKVTKMTLSGNDTLEVYNGVPGNNNTIIKFNQELPDLTSTPVIFYANGESSITFEWNSTKNGNSSFMIEVTPKNCSYTFSTVSSAVVSSPVYQTDSGTIQCTYTLKYGLSRTEAMVLSFDQVNIKKGNLSLSSGPTFQSGTTSIPDQIMGDATVNLAFQLSTAKADNGFTAVTTGLSPGCTSTYTLNDTSLQVFSSPDYPGNYGNNLKCRMIINSLPGTKLWLGIADFMMGDNTDHLTLKDGNSRSSKILGDFNNMHQPENSVLTSSNSVWIQFETDESKVSKGFRILIRPIVYGGLYRDDGYIRIENTTTVPSNTSKDIDDMIFIQLLTDPVNQMVADFSVPKGMMLPSSSISCFEGFAYDPPNAIANFKWNTPFYPVFTDGPAMLIVLTGYLKNNTFLSSQTLDISFKSREPDGALQYSLSDQGSFTLTKAQVMGTTPATWLIPAGEVTSLKFSTLEVMPQYEVNVYSGLETLLVSVAHFQTSMTSAPVMYLSNGVRVEYIKVTSSQNQSVNNDTDQLPVLVASYQNIPVCGSGLIMSRSGVITSPMYPDRYPFNAECMWTVSIPANKSIHLGFTDFQLAANHSLKISVVTVITKNHTENVTKKIIGEFDSQSAPSDIITNGSQLVVEFSSSVSYEVSTGFRLDFEVIDCGGNLTSSGKTISTPGFPAVTKGNTTCVWIVTLPPPSKKGNKNSVSFSYEIKGRKSNDTTILEIRDGGSSQSELITKDAKSSHFLSRNNQLYVAYRLQGADPNKTRGFAFQLKFESHECNKSMQCGSGICLHADWRCNGKDDCGDMTDEKNCTAMPPKTETHTGIKPWAVAVAVIITFLAAVLLTIFVPRLYNRIRNRRYSSLHEDISPEDM